MLMLDRYLVAGGRAIDLATGAPIRWHVTRHGARAAPMLFAARGGRWLIDFDVRGAMRIEVWERPPGAPPRHAARGDTVEAFQAALADAKDGCPRALDLAEPSLADWLLTWRALAREARLAGFVPVAADALGAVLSQARWRWPAWLKDRSLVIFATDAHLGADASLALFRLATRDCRPHLVVRAATAAARRPSRGTALPMQVHEAPAASALARALPESAESLLARATRLRTEGRPNEAEAAARWGVLLATSGDVHQAARCALARCLLDQRRLLEARAAINDLAGEDAEALRDEIARAAGPARVEAAFVDTFVDVLRLCQELPNAQHALGRVCGLLKDRLAAAAIACVTRDRGQLRVLAHAGTLPPLPQLEAASRVLDTGIAVPPGSAPAMLEAVYPVKYGAAVIGVIWCRWLPGSGLSPGDAGAVVRLAATAIAPAMQELTMPAADTAADTVPELVGSSDAMRAVRQAIVRAAASPFPVLVEGESGCGKELAARAIHETSPRRGRRFCALNCAALPDDLVEAELFGHTRGAFTGAAMDRLGLIEEAQGGTLFLDEVAELGARVQAKLLRVLQEGEVRRLGESIVRKVDVRVVAATNRPLDAEVAAGRFRADLRYRLDVLRIGMPPLRERLEDVPALVRHIWASLMQRTGSRAVLSEAALGALGAYDWPGNVRELQNVLASVMVAGPPKGVIGPAGLPAHVARAAALDLTTTLADARRAFEARYVRAALARAEGRTQQAARALGVSRQGLAKLLARLDVERGHGAGTIASQAVE